MANHLEEALAAAPPGSHKLYFAYGSNLSTTQMHSRCPASTPLALAHLPAPWEWLINERGYANVVRRAADEPATATVAAPGVYGVLYRLPPEDEAKLDRHEGVPFAYEKVVLPVTVFQPGQRGGEGETLGAGSTAEALVYVDYSRVGRDKPLGEYVGRMNRGIKEATEQFGLPGEYVQEVMRPFIPAEEA